MRRQPFFSIVIPTCNRASDLGFALFCIFRQSFSDFEVVIADDCSIDNTKDIINKFKDKRIHYFKNEENVGFITNITKAIGYAKGKYIFVHGDDDFIVYPDSLKEIYEKIKRSNVGYLRVNYLSFTPDGKQLFDFSVNKTFKKDEYLPAFSKNKDALSFILGSDPFFMTGIIIKRPLPENIKIIDSELIPWISILFYLTANFGSYIFAKPHIVASWSKKKIEKNNHPRAYYSLIDGKLLSENYYNEIQKKIDQKAYNIFLHNQLMKYYVQIFPAIKLIIGNKDVLKLASRICILNPRIKKTFSYKVYLALALIMPRFLLKIIRNFYYQIMYQKSSSNENYRLTFDKVMKLKQEYFDRII